jgi:hypothetical protein
MPARRVGRRDGDIVSNRNNSPQRDRSHLAPVTTREELFFLLERASELEHGLACIYLFAAYSLKSDASEGGLTETQATMVRGWKRHLAQVAVEEMLHLAQVSNMLTAIASGSLDRSETAPGRRPSSARSVSARPGRSVTRWN